MAVLNAAGGYVPLYRVRREAIAEQFGDSTHGETAVPGRDENHITMSVEAGELAVTRADVDPDGLGAVYSASVTDPFAEHGIAAHVAYHLGATGDVDTADFRGTVRAGTDALAAARNFVAANDAPALVVATDVMPVEPGHDAEAYQGAGSGAVVLSADGEHPLGELSAFGRHTTGFVEGHRLHGEPIEPGDERYEAEYGFGDAAAAVAQDVLADASALPSSAIVNVGDQRVARGAVDEFPGDVSYESTFGTVGYAGTASFYIDLARFLETGEPGDSALAVNYGAGGIDAALVEQTADGDALPGLTVDEQLDAKETVPYAKHLEYRERVEYTGSGL